MKEIRTPNPAEHRLAGLLRILPLLVLALLLPPAIVACGSSSNAEGDGADSTQVADADSAGAQDDGNGDEGEGDDGEENEKSDGKKKRREKTTSVNAAKVLKGDLVVPVVAEGAVRARHATEIRALLEGRIDRILVSEGQTVRKGQLLVRFDNREFLVELEEARSKYLEALGKLAADDETLDPREVTQKLEDQLKELERLESQGTITANERREREIALEVEAMKEGAYRTDLVKVRSGLAAAQAAQERAALDLENTEIRAPFSGVISNLTLTTGERVTNGQLICNLTDNVNLEAEVAVLESDLVGLETGRRAVLDLPALGDTLHARVDVMSPGIDPESRTCQVLLRFENPEGRIRPGMFVRAMIAGQIYPDRVMVPREAILTRDGRPLVFKVNDDRAEWVYIKTGLSNDRVVEVERVLQGGPLDPGTLVVVSDHLTLTHQAKIKVSKVLTTEFALASDSQDD